MDADQCARRIAQRVFKVKDPDYYEFEGTSSNLICPNKLLIQCCPTCGPPVLSKFARNNIMCKKSSKRQNLS